MSRRTRLLVPALAPALALSLALSACSGSSEEAAPDPDASQGDGAKVVEVSPVTGETLEDGRPDHPVLVVKIENTAAGAPQVGLDQADLVVEELVEGGLTRLAALYYSQLPSKVGHVRSLRGTDIGIAKPVGGQVVASGGADHSLGQMRSAKVTALTEDKGTPGFSSDPGKVRPYNRLVDLKKVARSTKKAKIPGPYLTWTPADADAAEAPKPRKVTSASVRFSPSSTTQWALRDGHWVRTNGHAAKEFRADTVVVMFADVGTADYVDPAGNPVPETKVRGSGRAVLLTADGSVETVWKKAKNTSTISFETKQGEPVTVDPGRTWIELVPKSGGDLDLG